MKKLSSVIENISRVNGFVILKPEFMKHENGFLALLKNNGWNIIQKKRCVLTQEQAEALYKPHKGKEFFNDLCRYMSSGECLCCLCQKDCDDPIKDMSSLKDKVRDKWGKDEMKNAMHSSDSIENVDRESSVVFNNFVTESISDMLPAYNDESDGSPIINELKSLYCEEINAFYQYWIVKDFLVGRERPSIAKKYEEYALDELTDHSAKILKRLSELNADITDMLNMYNNDTRTVDKYMIPNATLSTVSSIQQNIAAEEAAIAHYKRVILMTEVSDPVTNQMLKDILADEEEHRSELHDFLMDITSH